jgi:nucleoid-associated protein YgaU
MRPATKVFLVLFLVALAVVVLYFASRKWSAPAAPSTPTAKQGDRQQPPGYNDPVATYQRWRDRLTNPGDQPGPSPPTDASRPEGRDLRSTSRNEGTAVAHRLDIPVAGADPPGPVLRPEGIVGDIIRGPLAPRRAGSASGDTYTVAKGDTLCDIAMKHYGDARYVQQIVAANPGLNPNRLHVGDHIVLPDVSRNQEKTAPPSRTPPAASTKVYVVQKNDTLISIARKVYNDSAMYPKIYEANKDVLSSASARLYVGQRLRLPEPR